MAIGLGGRLHLPGPLCLEVGRGQEDGQALPGELLRLVRLDVLRPGALT